jgi:hypothetical protein
VSYPYEHDQSLEVGKRNFDSICALIKEERVRDSPHGLHGYDVILADVPESTKMSVNLVVTTSDPGPRDANAVLAKLFPSEQPTDGCYVEEIDPQRLRDPACQVIAEVHFDPMKDQ